MKMKNVYGSGAKDGEERWWKKIPRSERHSRRFWSTGLEIPSWTA
jgi:hypothetical protein